MNYHEYIDSLLICYPNQCVNINAETEFNPMNDYSTHPTRLLSVTLKTSASVTTNILQLLQTTYAKMLNEAGKDLNNSLFLIYHD